MLNITTLTEDVEWISECFEMDDGDVHMHRSQYLIRAPDGNILIDCCAEDDEGLVKLIHKVTSHEDVDTLLLTNSILPHTKNVRNLKETFTDLRIVSSVNVPYLVGLPDAEGRYSNEATEINGDQFTYTNPVLSEIVGSSWIYHPRSKVFFTAEGVGNYHGSDECKFTTEDLGGKIDLEYISRFYHEKMPWLEYADVDKLEKALRQVIEPLEIEYIAPIHGTPVGGDHIDMYIDSISEAVEEFEYSYPEKAHI